MLKKFNKIEEDLIAHNMVVTDFSGKTSRSDGVIALDITVGSVIKSTMFVVIPTKASYNLLLGREWTHGVGVVPSTLYKKIFIWGTDEDLELIEADGSPFEVAKVT